ncbi:hypothetical protein Acy02nite_81740 [Actinoplanes cyaneus]|uniref:Uncharacterized protein n=1 Tax=Actinoplanes cyaneus TaxID=52696 RepID=A0A919IRV5_9ACTN|nr:hypothetical protein Acy02nite_81740 [Actinoplanes cyaneus]
MQVALRVGQQGSGGGVGNQFGDVVGEHLQELDDVEFGAVSVSGLEEHRRKAVRRHSDHDWLPDDSVMGEDTPDLPGTITE